MSSQPYYFDLNKTDPLADYLQLIYIAISSLEIDSKLSVFPQNQTDLNFVISSLIKIIKKNDDLIHRTVSLWEQIETLDDNRNYYGVVQDYLDNFNQISQNNPKLKINLQREKVPSIALKILTDLLFYSSISGEKFLKEKLEKLFNQNNLLGENNGV